MSTDPLVPTVRDLCRAGIAHRIAREYVRLRHLGVHPEPAWVLAVRAPWAQARRGARARSDALDAPRVASEHAR